MQKNINIGTFVLDSLQIFFPWDDDLYTELKSKGFGTGKSKTLPLIYTDNTEVTKNVKSARRKYVIRPELFGKTYSQLNWEETDKPAEPIIPAEKPMVEVSVIFEQDKPLIKFKFITETNNERHYHLEYSSMAAFGKMYSNWANFYSSPLILSTIVKKAGEFLNFIPAIFNIQELKHEKQQNQREGMTYTKLPIYYYKFCLQSFSYLKDFLKNNGVKNNIPCMVFDSKIKDHLNYMEPYLKLGIVHTTSINGFDERTLQIVFKIAQDKITTSQRGKKAKVKGALIYEHEHETFLLIDAKKFILESTVLLRDLDQNSNKS